ncbi:MAG: CCA tRNA nucleotidyltransferase [Phycisphaerae bacterium]
MRPVSTESLARRVVEKLQSAGHVAYWAGGCVRDRLMERPPKDYDVATSARPEEVLRLFPRAQQVGAAFGVILVREKQQQVEVATFRADGVYSDGRHPDSVRFTDAREDAQRRDFTCNALFFDPAANELHDFVDGRKDIDAKILRAVGKAEERFAEDHLRMLRAVRFAARLGFAIEEGTRNAIAAQQKKIATISRERVGEEIRLMLEHPTRVAALDLLAGFAAMFEEVFGLPPREGAVQQDWPITAGLPAQTTRAVVLFSMLLDLQVSAPTDHVAALRSRLMLSNEETEELGWLAAKLPQLEEWEDLTKASLKRLMADGRFSHLESVYRADPANADQLLALGERLTSLREEGVAPAPLVTGDVLIKLGARPGPTFKRWLEALYDRQLEGEFPTADAAIAAARQLIGGQ